MNWISDSFRSGKHCDDLSEEIRLHIEERVESLISEGLSPEEARRQACVAFGNLALVEERSRQVWQWPSLESLWADVRYALRQLRRPRGRLRTRGCGHKARWPQPAWAGGEQEPWRPEEAREC